MQILNFYFTPFAAVLIIFAMYFSEPDTGTMILSGSVIAVITLLNYLFSRRAYRFLGWTQKLRTVVVLLNLAAAAVLFHILCSYWAPMWLLFLTAPATAAMFMSRWWTFIIAGSASLLMLGTYWTKGLEGGAGWGQAWIHAIFVIVFSLFVHALSQIALRMRDASR